MCDFAVQVAIPDGVHIPRIDGCCRSAILIDSCLVTEIEYLWSLGVVTLCSCCGHDGGVAYIGVNIASAPTMELKGYTQIVGNDLLSILDVHTGVLYYTPLGLG